MTNTTFPNISCVYYFKGYDWYYFLLLPTNPIETPKPTMCYLDSLLTLSVAVSPNNFLNVLSSCLNHKTLKTGQKVVSNFVKQLSELTVNLLSATFICVLKHIIEYL